MPRSPRLRSALGSLATVAALALLIGSSPVTAAGGRSIGPLALGFPAGDDWEPAIAADRFGHVYALWTHYGDDPACPGCASPHMELQVSADGGRTWSTPRPLAPSAERQDDPQIVVDPVDGRTVYAAFMQGGQASEYVARSDDYGASWRPVLVEPLERGTDKDTLTARGNDVYLVYHTQEKIYASISHDRGSTWTLARPVDNTNSKYGVSLPSGGAIDSRGTVYYAWNGVNRPGQAKGTINLYVTTSADGGLTWTTSWVDVSQAAAPCGCGGWDFWGSQMALAVDGRDRVYVLWNANREPYAPTRLYFVRSLDGGKTWVDRQDVSLAPVGTNNVFPALAATGDGDVRIAWQDDRNGHDAGNNDPGARWNTWYRTSRDGGLSWSAETQLSRYVAGYTYKLAAPKEGYLQPYGDYFELDIDGAGRTHVLWGEGNSYSGPGNIWYARP